MKSVTFTMYEASSESGWIASCSNLTLLMKHSHQKLNFDDKLEPQEFESNKFSVRGYKQERQEFIV